MPVKIEKKKPVPEFSLRDLTDMLMGAKMKGEPKEKIEKLQWEIVRASAKDRKKVIGSTPVKTEKKTEITPQGTVSAKLEDGNFSYSQKKPPKLEQEVQAGKVPKINVSHSF